MPLTSRYRNTSGFSSNISSSSLSNDSKIGLCRSFSTMNSTSISNRNLYNVSSTFQNPHLQSNGFKSRFLSKVRSSPNKVATLNGGQNSAHPPNLNIGKRNENRSNNLKKYSDFGGIGEVLLTDRTGVSLTSPEIKSPLRKKSTFDFELERCHSSLGQKTSTNDHLTSIHTSLMSQTRNKNNQKIQTIEEQKAKAASEKLKNLQERERQLRYETRYNREKTTVTTSTSSRACRNQNDAMKCWIVQTSFGNCKATNFKCEFDTLNSEGLRGMKASKSIKKGETICSIPYDTICINAKTILTDTCVRRFLYSALPEDVGTITFEVLYYIFLITHKRKRNSRFATYINSLPKNFDELPITWENSQISVLAYEDRTHIMEEKRRLNDIYDLMQKLSECSPLLDDLDYQNEFLWAYNVLKTRGFSIKYEKSIESCLKNDNLIFKEHQKNNTFHLNHISKNLMLAPFIDMINHGTAAWNADVEKDYADNFVLYAVQDIKCGEEIRINYFQDSTSVIFITYGFIDDCGGLPNPSEKVQFEAKDFHDDPNIYNRIISCSLFVPDEPKRNSLEISKVAGGCSWGMQKAAIIVSLDCIERLNLTSFDDIIEGNYDSLPCGLKKQVNECLRKVVRRKIRHLFEAIQELDRTYLKADVYKQKCIEYSTRMAKKICRIQIDFLENFLNEYQQLYTLIDAVDLEPSDVEEDDSGNETD